MHQNTNQLGPIVYNWKKPLRLLREEIEIIKSAFDAILVAMERNMQRVTSFPVSIEMSEPPKILTFGDLPDSTKLQFLFWSARLERKEETFAMLWDETSITPLLYGVLGGSLANAKHRINRKENQITNIEIGILFDLIMDCFMKPIINGFSMYHPNLKPRIDTIEPETRESLQLFPENEICMIFPLVIKWKVGSSDLFLGHCIFIFSQTFLRKFHWRGGNGKI
ncbi:hypothetical protein CLV96_3846 [Leptospira meyeri]|uniref:Uncharacterized protein n=1 Tax=Leptospira meyeri TaxID=29508 RepID=A0A4R8MJ60_LEPME|nr:hypothetical protein [Leptospira meyeri]EKJ85962.1 hypothetical protein LEP1GSC017_0385 [Leptospira meyeri serovar Hardjo str. Went 5]TDY66736.1 hypothetical protein CLV96_3846 [Leptospira meyeri]